MRFDQRAILRLDSELEQFADATDDEIVLSCFAATGAHDVEPVVEDRVRARRVGDGWRWIS